VLVVIGKQQSRRVGRRWHVIEPSVT